MPFCLRAEVEPQKSGTNIIINIISFGWPHRHLSNIDCLTARPACLVCFSSSVNVCSERTRKRKNPINYEDRRW